eukprot:TRINITY_DN16270_c0_g1_i4.p1 TRINITY_DN16270_c0_g1~~TRINITY_DN16270_c0_g1_i4.p1  ORF type:complete len:155 (+),score=19.30 TRINITY_DN16270_c0_g1_i4:75-539(+)
MCIRDSPSRDNKAWENAFEFNLEKMQEVSCSGRYDREYIEELREQYKRRRIEYEAQINELLKTHANMKSMLIEKLEERNGEQERICREKLLKQQKSNEFTIIKLKELVDNKKMIIEQLKIEVICATILLGGKLRTIIKGGQRKSKQDKQRVFGS